MAPPCRAAWYQARATAVVLVQGHVARNSSLRTSEGCIASRREVVWRRPGAVALLLRTLSRLSGGSRWKIRLVVSRPPARPSAGDTPCVASPPWSRVVYYPWSDCPPPPLPRPFPPLALGSAACHQYLDTGGSPWSSSGAPEHRSGAPEHLLVHLNIVLVHLNIVLVHQNSVLVHQHIVLVQQNIVLVHPNIV